jgi:hypothetical protein
MKNVIFIYNHEECVTTWQLGNLATWQIGNFSNLQFGNLDTWQFGKNNKTAANDTHNVSATFSPCLWLFLPLVLKAADNIHIWLPPYMSYKVNTKIKWFFCCCSPTDELRYLYGLNATLLFTSRAFVKGSSIRYRGINYLVSLTFFQNLIELL